MDLLSQRYASPFLLLDEFIRLNQLHEFICEVLETMAEEKIHKARWEYYLAKVHEMSFEAYVELCEKENQEEGMSFDDIGDLIASSKGMLEGFSPER